MSINPENNKIVYSDAIQTGLTPKQLFLIGIGIILFWLFYSQLSNFLRFFWFFLIFSLVPSFYKKEKADSNYCLSELRLCAIRHNNSLAENTYNKLLKEKEEISELRNIYFTLILIIALQMLLPFSFLRYVISSTQEHKGLLTLAIVYMVACVIFVSQEDDLDSTPIKKVYNPNTRGIQIMGEPEYLFPDYHSITRSDIRK